MTQESTKTNDMTKGSPLRLILAFAIPLFIGNIFQQIYNVADTMIAGYNLGDTAIAAIGATSAVFSLLMNFASGLNSGYGIIVAQAFGAKDQEKLKKSIAAMIALDVAITLILTVFALLFLTPLMRMINVPDSIFSDAHAYIAIIIAGMPATILYNMLAGIMRAVGNSKTPLYFLILSCGINLSMDCLFIIGFGWGVEGAAAATVIAESFSALFSGIYVLCKYREILPNREHFRPELPLLNEMAGAGFAMALMLCVVDIGSVIYQRAINGLGEMLIAQTAFGYDAFTDTAAVVFPRMIFRPITQTMTRIPIQETAFTYHRLNERVTAVEVIKTFTMDKDFPPHYDQTVVEVNESGAFCMISDYVSVI